MNKLNFKHLASLAKILVLSSVLVLTISVAEFDFKGLTKAFLLSEVAADSNPVETGNWTPDTPINLGYNVNNGDDYALPRPETEIACGGMTNINGVSHHWTDVSGGNPLVKYQRQYDVPWTAEGSWSGNEIYATSYTNYRIFSSEPGKEGIYNSRVRAFYDTNGNNALDGGESFSDWSPNDCRITHDAMPPVSAASYAGSSPTGNTTITIDHSATDNVAMVDTVELFYRYEALGGGGFDAWTSFETHDVVDGLAVAGSFVVDTTLLSGDGVYEFYTIGTDLASNVEAAPAGADTSVTVDSILPPAPAPVVTNSPTKIVAEQVVNGGFESGLAGWTTSGDVAATGADGYAVPRNGSQMAKVGVSTDPGNQVSVNVLQQPIPKGVRSIGFDYNFFSKELSSGADEPGMMVFINDKQVQQIWASDVIGSACAGANCTGWQHLNIYVGDVEDATLSIAFYAGNTINDTDQSWMYVDNVSTSDIVVNGSALFELNVTQDSGTTVYPYYQIGSDGTETAGNSFAINSQPTDGVIYYWSADSAGNKSATQSLSVTFDADAPAAVVDLGVTDLGGGDYRLSFTAPADTSGQVVSGYEVRYGTSSFDAGVNWSSLQVGQVSSNTAPRKPGEPDVLTLTNLIAGQEYHFALKSRDSANNWSPISNVAGVNPGGDPNTVGLVDSPIVINEFLPNPVGADSAAMPDGEWVELYNNSDSAIDVAGWTIKDAAANSLTIIAGNSDNNLDTGDAGETVVPAFGYLVTYKNGTGSFSLNNDGDTVELYDGATLIDSHTYTGSVPEGKSIAREHEGVGLFIDPEPTPGRANILSAAELVPMVKLYRVDDNTSRFSLFDSQAYESAAYSLLYNHEVGGEQVKETLQGSLGSIEVNKLDVTDLYFGTCSGGGEACTPHLNVNEVSLGIELQKADGTTKTLEDKKEGIW